MKKAVVDTNVPLCANGDSHVSSDCVLKCASKLGDIQKKGAVVLDDGWRIISEYKHKLSPSGQPGVGDRFLKWVLTNITNPARCEQVRLSEQGHDCFEEFPRHPGLASFDPSDRKFVAVAAAHPEHPPILQAADSKWWGWKESLEQCGIAVQFLCPEELREKYFQKMET